MKKSIVNKWIDKLKNIYEVKEIDKYLIDFLENLNSGCFLFINRDNNRWLGEYTKDYIWLEIKEIINRENNLMWDSNYLDYEKYFMENMENSIVLSLWDDGVIIDETMNFIIEMKKGMYDY